MATIDGANGSSTSKGLGRRFVKRITSSALLFLASFGFVVALVGGLVELGIQQGLFGEYGRNLWGLWAAIFVWWGVGLFVVGLAGRALIWIRRQGYVARAYGRSKRAAAPVTDRIRDVAGRVRDTLPGR